jgi:mono/diheme cytochrome c family protein/DNA-binding beta-propeller fold protein YncE
MPFRPGRLDAGLARLALLVLAAFALPRCAPAGDAATSYRELCSSCHGVQRYGGYAPPLIPDALRRRSDEELERVTLDGRLATQMPGFRAVLDPERARALVALMREPVGDVRWDPSDIAASRIEFEPGEVRIPPAVRRENLMLVVERGSGSISVLDGDSLEELDRFPVGRIHGGPKFDVGYRGFVAVTRDGTLVRYDFERGGVQVSAKVGVNTRNIALSPRGDFVAVANQLPASLVLLDGELRPLASFALDGQPSGVYPLPGRQSFLLALRDVPALYRLDFPEATLHRVELPEPFEDFLFVPGPERRLLASSRAGSRVLLYDVDRNEVLASLTTEALPHLFSAAFFRRDGVAYAALNHIGVPRLSILRMDRFEIEAEIPLVGSGYFVRTHPGTAYLWADTNSEAIQLVDKRTLAPLERVIVPEAGKKAMHVEFTADGKRALVSVWDDDGAVVVYDSETLEEVARLPYSMPVGKYNAFNKTRLLR